MPNILNERVLLDLKKCNLYLSGRENKISDRTLSTKSRKRGMGYEKTVRFQCGILQYYRSTYSDHCIMYRRNREEREPG